HRTDVELVSKLGYLLISDLAGNAPTELVCGREQLCCKRAGSTLGPGTCTGEEAPWWRSICRGSKEQGPAQEEPTRFGSPGNHGRNEPGSPGRIWPDQCV